MYKLILILIVFVSNLTLVPCISTADDFKYFSISLLGKQVGSLKIREKSYTDTKIIQISGEISSSPLSLFNGQFEYKSTITGTNSTALKIHYESTVDATFKERRIDYWIRDQNLVAVDVFPEKEQTPFTNPEQIDFEFIDPAYSITELLSAPCKNSFVIYDGRRIIDVISRKPVYKLGCTYLYTIRKGPRHLAPFNFKKFEISTFFKHKGNSLSRSMIVKSGPFKLFLNQVP